MDSKDTILYSTDNACDVRGEYIHMLKKGMSDDDAYARLLKLNQGVFGDCEEEPIFWFALADTQWNYGRLMPIVKEKALEWLGRDEELQRWKESGEKVFYEWSNAREILKNKLLSEQPPVKKVSKYRLYRCKWQTGDIYAYRFNSEFSEEKSVKGKYIVFCKISETEHWPGHINSTVCVFKWIGDNIPSLEEVENMPILPQKYWAIAYEKHPHLRREYVMDFLVTKESQIPYDRLTYLGNRIIPCEYEPGFFNAAQPWDRFEKYIIEQYFSWNSTK